MAQGLPKGQEQDENTSFYTQPKCISCSQSDQEFFNYPVRWIHQQKKTLLQGSSALRTDKKKLKKQKITFLGKWYHAVTLCLGIHLADEKLEFGKNEQDKGEA